MKKNYVVVESVNTSPAISWSSGKDVGETFATPEAAKKRAVALANDMPGEPIRIYELMAEVIAPVGLAVISKVKP